MDLNFPVGIDHGIVSRGRGKRHRPSQTEWMERVASLPWPVRIALGILAFVAVLRLKACPCFPAAFNRA